MATTVPEEFEGEPTLTPEIIETIKDWYVVALGDSDKADDVESEQFYTGQHEAFASVLALLYGKALADQGFELAAVYEGSKRVWSRDDGTPVPKEHQ